jgi:chemotaxis protein CheC
MTDKFTLSKFQLDALVEVGNIGMGHAATSLSKMLSKKIQMTVPYINFMPIQRLPEMFGNVEALVAGVYLEISGEANGKVLLLFPRDSALALADIIMNRAPGQTNILSQIDQSALMEVGNILIGSYLTALNDFTGLKLRQSVPKLAFDMVGAVMDFLIIEISSVAEEALVIETQLLEPSNKIKGYVIFLFDPGSPETILHALGVDQ